MKVRVRERSAYDKYEWETVEVNEERELKLLREVAEHIADLEFDKGIRAKVVERPETTVRVEVETNHGKFEVTLNGRESKEVEDFLVEKIS